MQKGLEHKGLIVWRKFAIVSSQNSSFSRCFFSSTLQELIFSEKKPSTWNNDTPLLPCHQGFILLLITVNI